MSQVLRAALVTGGAGFVGSHLVERLLREKAERVVVVDNFSTGSRTNLAAVADDPRLCVIDGDCCDEALLAELANEASIIFHLASSVGVQEVMTNRMKTLQAGARGVMAVLDSAAHRQVPVVYASTSEVYGSATVMPLREDARPAPGPSEIDRWGYAAVKLFGEYCVLAQHRERHSPGMVVRLFNTVGPRQSARYGMVLPRFVAAALAGQPLVVHGDGQQTRCFGHVGDVVEALLRLAGNPLAFGRVINIGSQEEVSILHLAELVIRATDSRSRVQLVPHSAVYGASFEDIHRRVPEVSRLRELAGAVPLTGVAEIVRQTVRAMAERQG